MLVAAADTSSGVLASQDLSSSVICINKNRSSLRHKATTFMTMHMAYMLRSTDIRAVKFSLEFPSDEASNYWTRTGKLHSE